MDAIELHGVSVRFDDLLAVDDIALSVAGGEIVGLLGHNGAGKTTLLRVINGLLDPERGQVRVLGRDPRVDGREVRRRTGVLTEHPALDEYLSPAEDLAVYAAINEVPRALATRHIEDLLRRLGIGAKRSVPSRHLSAGLKQRVALARALVHDPEVLLLDEPTTNLDPVAARDVRELVVDAARQRDRAVLLSTHNLQEAEEVCDRVGILRDGRLLSLGSPGDLRRSLGDARSVRLATDAGQAALAAGLVDGHGWTRVLADDVVEVGGDLEVPDLVARLVAGGVGLHRVDPVEPSLEDLYLHLHDRQPATGGS